jgi:Zn-dependent protease
MRTVLRVAVLVVVFGGVGWLAARAVVAHAGASTPEAQVRLSAAMAGLFGGGVAAVLVGVAVLRRR